MEFSEKTKNNFQRLLTRYPDKESALLPTLRLVEEEFGEITTEGMKYAADLLGLPPARVHGVFTFYTHYRRPGTGRHRIMVCATLPCALRNCESIFDHLRKRLQIDEGETTPDGKFTLEKVECLADCDRAPVCQINEDYYEDLTPTRIDQILEKLK